MKRKLTFVLQNKELVTNWSHAVEKNEIIRGKAQLPHLTLTKYDHGSLINYFDILALNLDFSFVGYKK